MKVAIIGSRNCELCNFKVIADRLPKACTTIISGGANGIDALARQLAISRGIRMIGFLPDYQKYGKRAPLVRNEQIVREADLVLAFWDFESRGTAHAIAQCIKTHVPVRIYALENPRDTYTI